MFQTDLKQRYRIVVTKDGQGVVIGWCAGDYEAAVNAMLTVPGVTHASAIDTHGNYPRVVCLKNKGTT